MYTITRPGRLFAVKFLQNLAFVSALAAFPCSAADAPQRVERDRLVRVRLAPEERAFIFGEGFTPVEIEPVASGLVFVGPPGRYAILVFGPASQQQLFVEIVDPSKPGPIVPPRPPEPPPGPPIPPPDPTPSVQNSYGVGLPAYENALKLALADECRQLSVAFSEAANDLHTGRLPADVKAKLDAVIDSLSPRWRSEWLPPVSAAVTAANAKYGTGLVARKSIYLEVSLALGKAAE